MSVLSQVTKICPSCGEHKSLSDCFSSDDLVLDHNHDNGSLRGILCRKCNSGLGFFKENLFLLETAINYLESSKTFLGGVQI